MPRAPKLLLKITLFLSFNLFNQYGLANWLQISQPRLMEYAASDIKFMVVIIVDNNLIYLCAYGTAPPNMVYLKLLMPDWIQR
jgi:hypothetical protein